MLEDGTVFEDTFKDKPITITIGKMEIIPGFERNIMGMNEGEEKEFTLKPEEAFGPYFPGLIKKIEKEKIKKWQDLKEGAVIQFFPDEKVPIIATVKKITDKHIVIDLNHPLAGKKIKFKVKILKVRSKR